LRLGRRRRILRELAKDLNLRRLDGWTMPESGDRSPEVKLILTEEGRLASLEGGRVIDATPSAGVAPSIAMNYLIENLKPIKLGELRSRYFPHVSLVSNGVASQPRIELYLHQTPKIKLILVSRNFVVEDNEACYEIARTLYRFLVERGALSYYLLSGMRLTGERGVYIASSDPNDAEIFLKSGAKLLRRLDEIPADKLSAYLMHFYSRMTGKAWLLIAEVMPYFPDPAAARDLLRVLSRALEFEIDLEKLEEEIEKQEALMDEFRKDYERMLQERIRGDRRPLYIG